MVVMFVGLVIIALVFSMSSWYAKISGKIHEIAPDVCILAVLGLLILVVLIAYGVLRLIESWQDMRKKIKIFK